MPSKVITANIQGDRLYEVSEHYDRKYPYWTTLYVECHKVVSAEVSYTMADAINNGSDWNERLI